MRKLSVVLVALALVVGFSVNAMAAQALFYSEKERLATPPTKELEVYGSVRVATYWITSDKEVNIPGPSNSRTWGSGQNFDDSDLLWSLDDGSTRFGVRFKSGKVGANVEIRPRDQEAASNGTASRTALMRHWYGSYDLGFGTFIVGQTWTPTFNPICNECLIGGGGFLDGFGDMGGSARKPGLQLHMPMKSIGGLLKVGLLEPTWRSNPDGNAWGALPTPLAVGGPGGSLNYLGYGQMNPDTQTLFPAPATWNQVDTKIPAIEASISAAFGPTSWTLVGGYNTFDVKDSATDQTQSIDAYLLGLDGTYSMGPFYLRGKFYWGQNLASFGSQAPSTGQNSGFAPALYTTAAGGVDVEDTTNWGWFAVAGFKLNDMLSIEAGYGERHAEQDNPVWGGTSKDTHKAFTIFAPISITPAFVITPEILYANFDELEVVKAAGGATDTVDRGKQVAYGIYWRIDF